jgi:hypothetical protein
MANNNTLIQKSDASLYCPELKKNIIQCITTEYVSKKLDFELIGILILLNNIKLKQRRIPTFD